MEKGEMYFDVNKARIYKKLYRPSMNIPRFVKTLLGIFLVGDSPISRPYRTDKKRNYH